MKVIRLASIICDHETEMLILFEKKYLKISNTLRKYLNTNTFHFYRSNTNSLKKVFKYFQIQLYLTPCLHWTGGGWAIKRSSKIIDIVSYALCL